MLNSQKNHIRNVLANSGFSGDDFLIEDVKFGIKIIYRNSKMWFSASHSENDYHQLTYSYSTFSPKFTTFVNNHRFQNIGELTTHLISWINRELKVYISETHSVDELSTWFKSSQQMSIDSIDFTSSEEFTLEEAKYLKAGLLESKTIIPEEFKLTKDQIEDFNQKINYLIEAVDRLPRKTDWKGIFISTVLGMISDWSLSEDGISKITMLFGKILEGVKTLKVFIESLTQQNI